MASRSSIPVVQTVTCRREAGGLSVECTVKQSGACFMLFSSRADADAILTALEGMAYPVWVQHVLLVEAASMAPSCEGAEALIAAAQRIADLLERQASLRQRRSLLVPWLPQSARREKNTTVVAMPREAVAAGTDDGAFSAPPTDRDPLLRITPTSKAVYMYERQPEVLRSMADGLLRNGLLGAADAARLPQALGFGNMPQARLAWCGRGYELNRMISNLKQLGWLPDEEGRGHSLWEKVCNVFYRPAKGGGEARYFVPDHLRAARCRNNDGYLRVDSVVNLPVNAFEGGKRYQAAHVPEACRMPACR
ncbi:MAG: hypothetical protein J6X62_02155 [Bacteroidales bacterium]|nr:hypothetical protein [Bacteroidales bacterium]